MFVGCKVKKKKRMKKDFGRFFEKKVKGSFGYPLPYSAYFARTYGS